MDKQSWEKRLREEGFSHIFTWRDRPDTFYPDHTHGATTAHVILAGEMTLTWAGKTKTFKAGQRCDVPANTVHSAQIGPEGCEYIIGEK